ncbi:LuxR family transcriptional regulator [Candidatus Magnetomorum sp. HK-1]|nr:LuxR family transcriptional regulator [Candidatus Magnetomorum sp. HK-1]
MNIKILLADDHKITRDGLCVLINGQSNMKVVGEAENGRSAVEMAFQLTPNVIVMDINMPELNGIDATHKIIKELPDTKIIILSMYSDKRYIIGALKAGVAGYLLKNCAFDELLNAINTVIKNKRYMSAEIADLVMEGYAHSLVSNEPAGISILTTREREVLQLIAEGVKTNEIASKLFVSVKTISTHRRQIMEKLNTDNIADLIKFALKEGLISLEA